MDTLKDPLTGELIEKEEVDLGVELDKTKGKVIVDSLYEQPSTLSQKERLARRALQRGFIKRPDDRLELRLKEYWVVKVKYEDSITFPVKITVVNSICKGGI